jgi:polysaccharide export outer membrane protein
MYVIAAVITIILFSSGWSNSIASASNDYLVGAGDLLKIAVFGFPDLAGDVRVSQSGNITFPLVGSVSVSGLSTRQIETKLSALLAAGHFIKDSQVTVLVTEYQSQRVAVMGEVTNPGQYPLQGSRRVLNLLADAGGVATKTAGDQVTLIRKDGTSISIDAVAMLAGDGTQNPIVNAGDIINVPKAPQFYVYGEVNKPGVYRLERDMTVVQAISAAGGLTHRGSERRLVVKRHQGSRTPTEVRVKGTDLLLPDDVLMVKEGWL